MEPTLPDGGQPLLMAGFVVALALYAATAAVAALRPGKGRGVLVAGIAAHAIAMGVRGVLIGYLPLTNKFESFAGASLAVAIAAALAWQSSRVYVVFLALVASAALAAALLFPPELAYAPPLMRTAWYPLHVPLSFLAYGLWTAAAGAALAWTVDRDPAWQPRIHRLALQGFGLWSAGMICGGVWGVLAWGAYFLWDPKVVWSVILWFHYATFVHLKLAPSTRSRPWIPPALALVGFAWVLVAYVGTSFLFGRSSHAF
jgi:ABC-type transport system involved in cytochrome c biogenesis permease subunit